MPNIEPRFFFREQVIALLRETGVMKSNEIAQALNVPDRTMRTHLQHMAAEGLIVCTGDRPVMYSLRNRSQCETAKPRTFQSSEIFTGVDWGMSTMRPGCQDHLRCPSRRGDKLVSHTGQMIHMN